MLGQRLGLAAAAIYWHITTKGKLVQLAGDAIVAEIELPDLEATDWRTAASEPAVGLHGMLTRHSWFGQAFGSYLPNGPGKSRYDDRTLAVYDKAGFAVDGIASRRCRTR
ncbi:TetR/AcrR family transcriptional regulator C-terminal domain-containing protein [Kribbella sp. NPDC050241]|uniref:TetR/AcrR family transcriptional regulator C-terminal domain-containing protein n=1 Tax=Kribbella sp. NPDC050241 TaxID=3364115 RepID=UPI0037AE2131